jgi:cytochrome P450
VGMSAIAANRDPAIWGADADDFRPERWLESPEKSRFLESHSMVFGGNGSRACIGKNIALVSLHGDSPSFPLPLCVFLACWL